MARRKRFIDPFEPVHIRRLVREFGSPLLIVDCERIRAQYRKLARALPGAKYYVTSEYIRQNWLKLDVELNRAFGNSA